MKRIFFIITGLAFFINITAQDRFTDARDGNSYRTKTIGGTTWMAENLKFVADGSVGKYFDNDPNNKASYGVLYDWKTAMEACPDGWHLPTGEEFHNLIDNYEPADPGVKAKTGPAGYGFQLAGMQNYEGIFTEMDESGYYWTSTEYNENEAEFFSYLIINGKSVTDISRSQDMPDIHGAEKSSRYSVRCVKNSK